MKKLPYFPFYYLDWLSSSSVAMMTYEEKGLFIDMLSRCYNDDGLPDDNNKLQRLFNCDESLLTSVKFMFYSVDGVLKNEKLDSVIKSQSEMISGKSRAGKASVKARAAKKLEKLTAVEHVLNPVQTEAQRNLTNKTEQNKTEQSNLKSKPKKDEHLTVSISIDPSETAKPIAGSFQKFQEAFPKPFNPMCSYTKSSFFQAVSIADGEDVILVAASMYAGYFRDTKQPIQYALKAQDWLETQSWKTDWLDETKIYKNQNSKNLSTSRVSKIGKDEKF